MHIFDTLLSPDNNIFSTAASSVEEPWHKCVKQILLAALARHATQTCKPSIQALFLRIYEETLLYPIHGFILWIYLCWPSICIECPALCSFIKCKLEGILHKAKAPVIWLSIPHIVQHRLHVWPRNIAGALYCDMSVIYWEIHSSSTPHLLSSGRAPQQHSLSIP